MFLGMRAVFETVHRAAIFSRLGFRSGMRGARAGDAAFFERFVGQLDFVRGTKALHPRFQFNRRALLATHRTRARIARDDGFAAVISGPDLEALCAVEGDSGGGRRHKGNCGRKSARSAALLLFGGFFHSAFAFVADIAGAGEQTGELQHIQFVEPVAEGLAVGFGEDDELSCCIKPAIRLCIFVE